MQPKQIADGEIIIGFDPGSRITGFGLVELKKNGRIYHIGHGVIDLRKNNLLEDRLKFLALDLLELIERYNPRFAAVENVFTHKNMRSALILGQARGTILAILGIKGVQAFDFSATAIKNLVSGRGHAQKFQVAEMVALQLGIKKPEKTDASDGLAAALALAIKRKESL